MKQRMRKKRIQATKGMYIVVFIVMSLFTIVSVKRVELNAKSKNYADKEVVLTEKIKAANKEKADLEEQEKYMQTKKFIEEIAKDKLGLVNPDEKIFKADK